MNIVTLNERIAKAEETIAKKTATIAKKTALIEKKTAQIEKTTDENDRYWLECDVRHLKEDIARSESEIVEKGKTIENYRKQLAGEIERQDLLAKEVPETLKTLQTELVTEWDAFDKKRRQRMIDDYYSMSYRDFCVKYRGEDTDLRHKTDEQIHESNVRDAEGIILNLVNRVKSITGEITDWAGMRLAPNNMGWSILNGRVEGKEGIAYVESIGAGGYNIQRYHIRVLVKQII